MPVSVRELTDEQVTAHFPVQGWRLKCGLRTDKPKKERVHDYVTLGPDMRNSGRETGFIHGVVDACYQCGADRFRVPKPPKMVTVRLRAGGRIEVRDLAGNEIGAGQ